MTRSLCFDPADTFIVRDGRPFNQDDAGQVTAVSLFPPPPFTLYGATRVALARALGWTGRGNWTVATDVMPPEQKTVDTCRDLLGDRLHKGALEICGPFLVQNPDGVQRVFVPAPFNLAATEAEDRERPGDRQLRAVKAASPCDPELECDLDKTGVRFLDLGYGKDVSGRWFDIAYLPDYLADMAGWGWSADSGTPSPLAAEKDVVEVEGRIGLTRKRETRLVQYGQLYASARRRLRSGWRIAVELNLEDFPLTVGAPHKLPTYVPFGSESRFAYIEADEMLVAQPQIAFRDTRYAILLLTPALTATPIPGEPFAGLPGTVACAAISRIGFQATLQDSMGSSGPAPVRIVIPAGSVIFFECAEGERPPSTDRRPPPLGAETHAGYGHYLIGSW